MARIVLGGVAVAALALNLGAAGPAAARPPRPYPLDQNGSVSGVPNIPDQRGCVKWCFRDMGPCDPPEYKRTDGRCNLND